MKLVLISDLHSSKKALSDLDQIVSKENPDGIICAGDITNRDTPEYFFEFEKKLKSYSLPAFVIWGNNEPADLYDIITNSEFSCHLKKKVFGKDYIYGISDTDDLGEFDPNDINGAILVTHKPPLRKNLQQPLKNGPKLHLCGHIHIAQSVYRYPSTTLVQIPSLLLRKYVILETEDYKVVFKSLNS